MSRITVLRLLGAVAALLFLALAIQAAPLEPPIPAIQLTFSEASFHAILAQWQPGGVDRFRMHFAIDFPFLVSYGLLGYLYAAQAPQPARRSAFARSFPWILPAAALMDAGENLLHLYFIHPQAAVPGALYWVAGSIATSKWLLIAAFAVGAIRGRVGRRVTV